jgi:hypothetical protein
VRKIAPIVSRFAEAFDSFFGGANSGDHDPAFASGSR